MFSIRLFAFIILFICAVPIWGTGFSAPFLIGANVYNHTSDVVALHDSIGMLLREGCFNAGTCTAKDTNDPNLVTGMVNSMVNNNIDVILEDYVFDPEAGIYGARTLSGGNYFRFEAEYSDSSIVEQSDETSPDSYFYKSPNWNNTRIGYTNVDVNDNFSNKHYWQVNAGQVGYAYHDLTYKWPIANSDVYYRIGQEFRFPYSGLKADNFTFFNQNKLYITFAMQVVGLEALPDSTILARIVFTNRGLTTQDTTFITIKHTFPASGYGYTQATCVDKTYLMSAPVLPNTDIHLITAEIPLVTLHQLYNDIIDHGGGWDKVLVNLNPTLYWYGHGTLRLDYVEFQDKLYKDYTSNNAVLAQMLSTRTFGAIYLDGMDEPQPGQFQSFYRISRYLESVDADIELISPVHDYKKEVVKTNGSIFSRR